MDTVRRNIRTAARRALVIAGTWAAAAAPCHATPEPGAKGEAPPLREQMDRAYDDFRSLQLIMASRERFFDAENEPELRRLIDALAKRFDSVAQHETSYSNDPGFASTVKVLRESLRDAKRRFGADRKDYALWRLRSATNSCIACHTRFEAPIAFSDTDGAIKKLTSDQKAQFYLATRQFAKAKDALIETVKRSEGGMDRIDALRRWLVLYVRVFSKPGEAADELKKLRKAVKFTDIETAEIDDWISSLRRWEQERDVQVEPLRRVRHWLEQVRGRRKGGEPESGSVELLRATATLHQLFESYDVTQAEARSYVLWLLGEAYMELPFAFVDELPESFFEDAIRANPHSETARRAYARYRELSVRDYTGSGGTRIPPEVQRELQNLYALAQPPRAAATPAAGS